MKSVLMRPPGERVLDAPALREAEVAALADDAAAQFRAVDPHRVVGAVADLRVRLVGGLHVGADAAVPEQVDRQPEDRADDFVRRGRRRVDAEQGARLGRQRDRLLLPRMHAAALRQPALVVVLPARARQREHAPALGEAGCGIGRGVDEDVAVVEGRDQADVLRQQHRVAEYVARHVADAGDREVLRLGVVPELAEVAPHGLPAAARRDAHVLVVVAGGAAGREGIAEPEPVLLGDRIGDVGELGRALVGGDDQVGVVAVVAHDARRGHDLAADDVVRHVEQRADERAVAGGAVLPGPRRGPAGRRRGTKPPLAPTGTITVFLTFCAFISPRISVRKSSRRSDQRRPPRATRPIRRCTPSTRGEWTKISNIGFGSGTSASCRGSSLSAR